MKSRFAFLLLSALFISHAQADASHFGKCLANLSSVLGREMKGWKAGSNGEAYFIPNKQDKALPSKVLYLSQDKFYEYDLSSEMYAKASTLKSDGTYFVSLRRPMGDSQALLTDIQVSSSDLGDAWIEGGGLQSKLEVLNIGTNIIRKSVAKNFKKQVSGSAEAQKEFAGLISDIAYSAKMAQDTYQEMQAILPHTSFVDAREVPASSVTDMLHNELVKNIPLLSEKSLGTMAKEKLPALFESCRPLAKHFPDLTTLLNQAEASLKTRETPRVVPKLKKKETQPEGAKSPGATHS